MSNSDPV